VSRFFARCLLLLFFCSMQNGSEEEILFSLPSDYYSAMLVLCVRVYVLCVVYVLCCCVLCVCGVKKSASFFK